MDCENQGNFQSSSLLEVLESAAGAEVDAKKDGLAIVYLYQAIPEDIVMRIAHLETAKDIWDALKTRYVGVERVREARIESLQYEFDMLKMKDSDSIDDFVAKVSQLASKASNLGEPFDQRTLVRKLMKSVPRKRYLAIVATIEQFTDLKTLTFQEAVGRLKAFEERYADEDKNSNGKQQEQLMYTYEEWKSKSNQKNKQKEEMSSNNTSQWKPKTKPAEKEKKVNRFKKDKSKVKCFRCDEYGNFASSCPTRKKEKGESNLAQEDGPVLHLAQHVVFLKESRVNPKKYDETPCDKNTWILDNGASNHMTGMRNGIQV